MTVLVNGRIQPSAAGRSLAAIVRSHGRDPDRPGVAVALNGEVVRRAEWPVRVAGPGDRIEIVVAVQGG